MIVRLCRKHSDGCDQLIYFVYQTLYFSLLSHYFFFLAGFPATGFGFALATSSLCWRSNTP